jgi:hypothetical protein
MLLLLLNNQIPFVEPCSIYFPDLICLTQSDYTNSPISPKAPVGVITFIITLTFTANVTDHELSLPSMSLEIPVTLFSTISGGSECHVARLHSHTASNGVRFILPLDVS